MIHTLDTKAADYIPELGDGFEEGSEGSENAQGLQVADYYADADGEGIYYITYKIETAKEIERSVFFMRGIYLFRFFEELYRTSYLKLLTSADFPSITLNGNRNLS